MNKRQEIERHIKTHSVTSAEDRAAVAVLETFLRSGGKINTKFSSDDKWPNDDGGFQFVSNPDISRNPEQNFFVQIKGSHNYIEKDGIIKYSLKSLAFPAYIRLGITLDPGILFVVVNPDMRGCERVFWKYMSVDFVNSIDYDKDSVTISFTEDEEIKNTDKSIDSFCKRMEDIVNQHSFASHLENRDYSEKDIIRIIKECDRQITKYIDGMELYEDTRDEVSKRILTRLKDLCASVLMLNCIKTGNEKANLRLAWERSLLDIETKYLGTFYKSFEYIGMHIPDDGQSQRLMLKYYDFLWQIKRLLKRDYGITVLHNLEKFPLHIDELDKQYYELVVNAIKHADLRPKALNVNRFYIQKKTLFFIEGERYYEVTLQLADIYATKYNRITAYTKENISTNYSVQIACTDAVIDLWGIASQIKIITNWKVSIEPASLNKLGKILHMNTKISSNYGEYSALMGFLTKTGMNLLDFIDLQEVAFTVLLDKIYENTNTTFFKQVLIKLKNNYSKTSKKSGRNIIRYLLLNLREKTLESVMPSKYYNEKCLNEELDISKKCFPFDRKPFIFNLAGSRTSEQNRIKYIASVAGYDEMKISRPYLALRNKINQTGEIYFEADSIAEKEAIEKYNLHLDSWEHKQGYGIKQEDNHVCIEIYEITTISILQTLQEISSSGNKGQREFNQNFINQSGLDLSDSLKEQALRNAFVDSRLLLIYGAAGTGKTTLINYISNMMSGRRKLFLTKTHTALQNLKRRIENAGLDSDFVSIDSFTRQVSLSEYDIIFVDECSTIDNRTMQAFLDKLNDNTFLVLAGDIHQIESIDFGNWFFYAKDIIQAKGSNVELLNTWRTEDSTLIDLWNEVRMRKPMITERLVIDGPFSEDIGPNILKREEDDEVILCLNYDGKFGLNNMNKYFQNANKSGEQVYWQEWSYKVGDPILFNVTERFPVFYNNLKGRIVEIQKDRNSITFTVDVDMILTEMDCQKEEEIEFIDIVGDNTTRVRFTIYAYDNNVLEENKNIMRMRAIVPFQIAYAVSIHKAQGLEYDSVKVIIPNSNSEKITHGVFYTAITRAKKKLKIYWSSETMKAVVDGFSTEQPKQRSLEIVLSKL